ncbi:MAG: acyl-CoA dehydratase activase [Candidatus Cloacimonadota bacterium]
MYKYGIDIGSRFSKLCLLRVADKQIIWLGSVLTDISPVRSALDLYHKMLKETGITEDQITASGSTGYGRHLYQNSGKAISEISCHAAGVRYHIPEAGTIIDIGGQDSKIISLSPGGKIGDFVMNDKCAAGTGRFLEMTAIRLGVEIDQISALASKADQDLVLSSTCVVFAESEIIGLMATNASAENIARAVHLSIARRIHSQMAALQPRTPVVFTGGLARSEDLRYCLEKALNTPVQNSPHPEYTGAIGAAIMAE